MNKMVISNSQQDVILDLPPDITNIALKISGGADSAILCYILALYKKNYRPDIVIHTITSISSLKKYQKIFSDRVLEKVSSMLNVEFGNRFINDVDSLNYNVDQFNFAQDLIKDNKFQIMFIGETKNPPLNLETDQDPPEGRDGVNMPTIEGTCYAPFKNINKKGIHELYNTLGVLEDIFPLTRSCEDFPVTDFSKHCEKCWFCAERLWGFGRYV